MKVITLALVLALSTVVGCAHLGALDKTVLELTEQVVGATEQLHASNVITPAQFTAASLAEHDVAVAGSAFNQILRAGKAKPVDASALLKAVRTAVTKLRAIAAGPFKQVLDTLAQLDAAVSRFMGSDLAATIKGA